MPSGDLTLYASGYSLLEKTKLAQSEQRKLETLDSSGRPKVERFFIEDTYSVVAPRAAAPSVGVSTTTFTSSSFTTDFATSPTPTVFPTPSPSPSAGFTSGFIPDFSSGDTEFADPIQAAGGGSDLVLDRGYVDEPNRLISPARGSIQDIDISVIDEDSQYFFSLKSQEWFAYRQKYPRNNFVLLRVIENNGSYFNFSYPPGFILDPKAYTFDVLREGIGNTDWFNLLDFAGLMRPRNRIHLIVDESGSMTVSDVATDLSNFTGSALNRGLVFLPPGRTSPYYHSMRNSENWIRQHIFVGRG
jgi:hypothetical protein